MVLQGCRRCASVWSTQGARGPKQSLTLRRRQGSHEKALFLVALTDDMAGSRCCYRGDGIEGVIAGKGSGVCVVCLDGGSSVASTRRSWAAVETLAGGARCWSRIEPKQAAVRGPPRASGTAT